MSCLNCGSDTPNPKFCSRSCAAIYNNKLYPKRKIDRVCAHCDSPVRNYRSNLCEKHFQEKQEGEYRNRSIGEYRSLLSVRGKHPSWANSHIRLFARSWNKALRGMPCVCCGYSKHVQLAHIKAVADFDDSALLRDVNSEKNLLPLCPNCHWEFDNGYREEVLQKISKRES